MVATAKRVLESAALYTEEWYAEQKARYAAMPKARRQKEKRHWLGRGVEAVAHLAALVAVAQQKGESLEGYPDPQGLLQVANGEVDAGLYFMYGGSEDAFEVLKQLPLEQQQQVVENRTVKVVNPVPADDGEFGWRERNVDGLRVEDLKRIVGPNGLRTVEEQVEILKQEANVSPPPEPPEEWVEMIVALKKVKYARLRAVAVKQRTTPEALMQRLADKFLETNS